MKNDNRLFCTYLAHFYKLNLSPRPLLLVDHCHLCIYGWVCNKHKRIKYLFMSKSRDNVLRCLLVMKWSKQKWFPLNLWFLLFIILSYTCTFEPIFRSYLKLSAIFTWPLSHSALVITRSWCDDLVYLFSWRVSFICTSYNFLANYSYIASI